MRFLAVILVALLFAAVGGCNGDGDTTSEDSGDGNGGNGNGGSSTVLLALGDVKLGLGQILAAQFMVTEAGTLKVTVTWSTLDPDRVEIYLEHEGNLVYLGAGPSGVTKTQTVTAAHVAGGPSWKLYLVDPFANPEFVNYKVEFTPD